MYRMYASMTGLTAGRNGRWVLRAKKGTWPNTRTSYQENPKSSSPFMPSCTATLTILHATGVPGRMCHRKSGDARAWHARTHRVRPSKLPVACELPVPVSGSFCVGASKCIVACRVAWHRQGIGFRYLRNPSPERNPRRTRAHMAAPAQPGELPWAQRPIREKPRLC